ncbi:MAG: AAA family ATPase [Phycisphaerales bacterium]
MRTNPYIGEPMLERLDKVPLSSVRWLWPGRIPLGKVSLIAGDPGLGKSFITLDMASRLSRADGWPDDAPCSIRRRGDDMPGPDDPKDGTIGPYDVPVPGDTILLSAEDDPADTLRPRLEALKADLKRIRVMRAVSFPGASASGLEPGPVRLDRDIAALDMALDHGARPRLIVIDPISAYLGDADGNSNHEMRRLLMSLGDLAARRGVAIVCVTHLSKGGAGGKAVYRAMGSLAFTAAARVVWAVSKDPDEPKRRLVVCVKSNIAKEAGGLAYRIEDGRLRWEEGAVTISADELEQAGARGTGGNGQGGSNEAARAGRTGEPGSGIDTLPWGGGGGLDHAVRWLHERLSEGPASASVILDEARQCLIAERTLARARNELGVVTQRETTLEGKTIWVLKLP